MKGTVERQIERMGRGQAKRFGMLGWEAGTYSSRKGEALNRFYHRSGKTGFSEVGFTTLCGRSGVGNSSRSSDPACVCPLGVTGEKDFYILKRVE